MRVSTAANQQKHVSDWSKKERHYVYLGLAFASPWIIGFLAFTVYPFFGSLYLSLTEYDLFSPPKWVGLQNYELIFADDRFYKSLGNTFFMAFISVPITLTVSLLIAVMLNFKVKGINYYRTIFYLPSVIPIVASALLWTW
ncbi:sugar ABC transporter permease, partial [Clostridium perfringens]